MKIVILATAFVSLSSITAVHAGANEGDAEFFAISDLTYQTSAIPTLIGGRPANPSDWPAGFYSLSAGGSCTSTLVGPRVLFTAAHCVGNGREVTIKKSQNVYKGICTHAKEYKANDTADYALCLMSEVVPSKKYERISIDPSQLRVGNTLLLTGFGCTRIGGGGGNDGVYRIGESRIQVLPAGDNNDIVTKGKVALCYGDSGGPAYILYDGGENGARVQVSINSRGNIYNTSYLSSLSTKMAVDFITEWANVNNVTICGVHDNAIDCHE